MSDTVVSYLQSSKSLSEPQKVLINPFAVQFPLLGLLPVRPITTGDICKWTVYNQLPSVSPTDYGTDHDADMGRGDEFSAQAKNYGAKMMIDFRLKSINPGEATQQELMQLFAASKKVTTDIIDGSGTNNTMVGLKTLLGNSAFAGQTIYAGTTDGGDALTQEKVDALMQLVNITPYTRLIMHPNDLLKLTNEARDNTSNQLAWAKDDFGRMVTVYNGVPILSQEFVDPLGNWIFSTTELASTGSNATARSAYLINFSPLDFFGFQPAAHLGFSIEQISHSTSGSVNDVTRIHMPYGVGLGNKRGAARLGGLKD